MTKDFDRWNKHKKNIHTRSEPPFYHEREIWWCAVGVNVGNEIDGTGNVHDRPVLILRGFNAQTFLGVCLIGRRRSGKYYVPVGAVGNRQATANLSQVRILDTKRLIRKMTTLDETIFLNVARKAAIALFPSLRLK